jgi:ribonuclease HI
LSQGSWLMIGLRSDAITHRWVAQVNTLWVKVRQEESMRQQALQEASTVWSALEEAELSWCATEPDSRPTAALLRRSWSAL